MIRPTLPLFKPAAATAAAAAAATTSFIRPFSPTGLAGLLAHPAPRPALIAIYNTTLTLLGALPAHSTYRSATTNMTKHRLAVVSSVLPLEYAAYHASVLAPLLPSLERLATDAGWPATRLQAAIAAAQLQAKFRELVASVPDTAEGVDLEALRHVEDAIEEYNTALAEAADPTAVMASDTTTNNSSSSSSDTTTTTPTKIEIPMIPPEPPLTADQVAELESKLDSGLIEEVVMQGVAEMDLVKQMHADQPWEPLIEEPVEGQWVYFERKAPAENTV